jgi:hypothetical protein
MKGPECRFGSHPSEKELLERRSDALCHKNIPGYNIMYCEVRWGLVGLGGLVVECLPLESRFACSDPAEDDEYLREIKIHNTTSFRGEIKLSVPCHTILQHVKKNL